MIRRFSAALIGLALCFPVFSGARSPRTAPTPFVVSTHDEQANDTLVGTVTNHMTSRRANVTVTATWETGDRRRRRTPPSSRSPTWLRTPRPASILDPDADVSALGAPTVTVTATGTITGAKPTGALQVEPGDFAGDVYSGQRHQ